MSDKKTVPTVRGNALIAPKDQGRECYFQIRWTLPEGQAQEPLALLLALLDETPKAFVDQRDYALHLDMLGDASIDLSLERCQGSFSVTMMASCPSNRFMRSIIPVEDRLVGIAKKLMLAGPRLDPVSMSLAKGRLIRLSADLEGDPSTMALSRLASILPESSLMGSVAGNPAVIKEVAPEQVEKAHRALLESPCAIAVKNLPSGATNRLIRAFGSDGIKVIHSRATSCNTQSASPIVYSEITASDVVLRCYRFEGSTGDDLHSWVLRYVVNQVLSGSDSLLFKEIREKRGLTYSATSSFSAGPDVVTVSMKTSLGGWSKSVDALDEVFRNARSLVTDSMIEDSVNDAVRDFQQVAKGSVSTLCAAQMRAVERGRTPDISAWIQEAEKIGADEIREALGKFVPLTGVVVTRPVED